MLDIHSLGAIKHWEVLQLKQYQSVSSKEAKRRWTVL